LELLWVKFISVRTNLLVGVLYAPGYDLDVFTKLRTSLQLIPPRLRRNLVLLGDFNCPDYSIEETSVKTRRTRELVSVIKEFAIFQRVRGDTRQRKTSCSCLDLVFVSQLSLVRCVSIVPPPSSKNDHAGIQWFVDLWTCSFPSPPRPTWIFDTGDVTQLRKDIRAVDWKRFFTVQCNSDLATACFEAKLIEIARRHFRLKMISSKRLTRPSLSSRTVDSLKRRDAAFRLWNRSKEMSAFTRWVECARISKRAAKTRYLRNIATSSRRNPDAVWKHEQSRKAFLQFQ
ncbi:hypothetical protein RvY_04365-2, partial [Ramazzottius varieornatus]